MAAVRSDIIVQLQKSLLPLQGFKTSAANDHTTIGLGIINNAFPNNTFPLGAVHEFIDTCYEDATATTGFISGILCTLMKKGGVSLWINSSRANGMSAP